VKGLPRFDPERRADRKRKMRACALVRFDVLR
jgi:hypothetical protein